MKKGPNKRGFHADSDLNNQIDLKDILLEDGEIQLINLRL